MKENCNLMDRHGNAIYKVKQKHIFLSFTLWFFIYYHYGALETKIKAKFRFVEPENIKCDDKSKIFVCLEKKLSGNLIFGYFWRPSWAPSWFLRNASGWEVPTRRKFKVETKCYPKMQRNTYQEKLQGCLTQRPD